MEKSFLPYRKKIRRLKIFVGKKFLHLAKISSLFAHETSSVDLRLQLFVGEKFRHPAKISSLFTEEFSTDKV